MAFGFSVSLITDRTAEFAEWVRIAEDEGFNMVGLTDSPSVYVETYVSGAICAMNTKRIRFGVRATNPMTRHPLITASAVLALDELSGGRAILGVGTGDSGVYQAGLKPAKVERLGTYVRQVIRLLDGEAVEFNGKQIRLERAKSVSPERRTRVYIAAAGPKTLKLAGQVADGVIIGTGIRPDVVKATLETIREGAEESGRRLEDLDLWWLAACYLAPNRKEAIEDTRGTLAAMCNATFEITTKGKHLPPEMEADVEHLVHNYDFQEHVKPGRERKNALLVERGGLKEYLASRFLIGGSPEECVEQIQGVGELGVKQLWWTMAMPDKPGFLKGFGQGVLGKLA